jgi:hypothetical protein
MASIELIAGIAGGTSALAIAAGLASPFVANWLSKTDTVFTKVPEGTVKAIMRGQGLERLIICSLDSHLNDPGEAWFDPAFPNWEVLDNQPGVNYDSRSEILKTAGVYYIGLIPAFTSVKRYQFRWNEARLNEETHKLETWSRDRETDFIYISDFPYRILLSKAECKDGIPLDIEYQLVIRITNPAKALFSTENWLESVSEAVIRQARSYVGSRTYKELLSESDEKKGLVGKPLGPDDSIPEYDDDPDSFSCKIIKLSEELPDDRADAEAFKKGLSGRYGVTIVGFNPLTVEIVGDHAGEYEEATVAEFTADKKAYATRTAGQAEADAELAKGTAQAEVMKRQGEAKAAAELAEGRAKARVIALKGTAKAMALKAKLTSLHQFGRLGELVAQVEGMKANGPGKTVIWANNPFISSIPGLVDVLNSTGLKSAEDLNRFLTEYFGKYKGANENGGGNEEKPAA